MQERTPVRAGARWAAVLLTALTVTAAVVVPAWAINFTRDGEEIAEASYTSKKEACPTLTTPPPAVSMFFNIDDMNQRGFADPGNQDSWDYLAKVAQVICGAEKKSTIKVGMFFIRALGTMTSKGLGDRPESDPEVIYAAMEWVKKHRGVKIEIVLEDSRITGAGPRAMIYKRLKNVADVWWCQNGCFNINSKSKYPSAVNHEKFMTISDTIWESGAGKHPLVLSSSGNWARSQVRNFFQETTLIYDDHDLYDLFAFRYDMMEKCAQRKPDKKTRGTCKKNPSSGRPASYEVGQKLALKGKIWVDLIHTYTTDSGRGTSVSFAPVQQGTRDFYIQAFDQVDCKVDPKIRVAMYQLSLPRAQTMVESLVRLKKAGCDPKVILTARAGSSYVDPAVIKLLKKKKVSYSCAALPMHTKIILIGPKSSTDGRVMSGTANWSVAGLRYSEEHTLTFDPRTASAKYKPALQELYASYLEGWYDLWKDASTKTC